MISFPYKTQVLKIEQPLGTYWAAVLPAELLLKVCYSDALSAIPQTDGSYHLEGTQRAIEDKRLHEIAQFARRADAAFPNAIILAANSRASDGFIELLPDSRWSVTRVQISLSS